MKSLSRIAAILLLSVILPAHALEDKYLDANGVKIRYIDTGKGEAIVLLHGGTSTLESWTSRGVVDNLAKDFRIIAFDARGHGKSSSPREPAASLRGYRDQAVTPEQMAAVKVPTLGIVGTLDHTLKSMQELKTIRPGMKLVLLEGVSHTGATGIQGRPELVAGIRSFIAEQRKPGTTAYQ